MWNSCITTLAIRFYIEKEVVFADISYLNISISKIIDLIRPVEECAEMAFSGRQNTENEHCETLSKLIHKSKFNHETCLYKILNVVFVYYYSTNLRLQ